MKTNPAPDTVRYLTTEQVAARYHAAPSTVRCWRLNGYGPKFVKVGRRALYAENDLARFEASQVRKPGTK
ncbi:DNA-binding protein [Streptomyces lunaelactis]|uniref:DNA-binding protein n=1 Tax=Streptomyces lunaelactis TaxID=1535768 RepID=A0A2R4T1H4_9ACTN|nr:helix-turn-helix domain-containing protein [Streptomyces lunaelactis]AVZ72971.1 DNA-binding protein [Streptomyces lunaelactis]